MNDNLQNILSDNSEALLDTLITNEVLKEIPIIGTSLNMIKAVRSIRDTAYLNKIKRFVEHIGKIDNNQRQRLIEESKKDQTRRTKFGEAVFTTIEQSDSMVKVEYTAIAFEAFLNEDVDDIDLRLMTFAINNTFVDTLISIIESKNTAGIDLSWIVHTGLADAEYQRLTIDSESTQPHYKLSEVARNLRNAWQKYGKAVPS